MKKYIVFASAALMLLASCAKENLVNDSEDPAAEKVYSLTIGLPDSEPDSKATLSDADDGYRKVTWNTGDKVCVNGIESDALSADYDGKATATFTFTGNAPASPFRICYPADCWVDNSHINLPAVQGDAAGADNAVAFPMAGYSTSLDDIVLKQLCAFVKLQLKGTENLKYAEFRGNAGEQVSGTFGFKYNAAEPALTPTTEYGAADQTVRVLSTASLSSENAQYCIVAVPAGTYDSGLNIRVVTTDNHYFIQNTSKSKTFSRAQLKAFNEFTVGTTGNYYEIKNASDWNTYASGYVADRKDLVEIANDIDFDEGALSSITPQFKGIVEGQGHTLSNFTATQPLVVSPKFATFNDLTLAGTYTFTVTTGARQYCAPFAGYADNSNYSNCSSSSGISVTGTANDLVLAGGLVGQNHNGVIEYCTNSGSITLDSNLATTNVPSLENQVNNISVGGMTGQISGTSGMFKRCANSGAISYSSSAVKAYIGGVVGAHSNGVVLNCTNTGAITVSSLNTPSEYVGGVTAVVSSNLFYDAQDNINRNSGGTITVSNAQNLYCGGLYGYIDVEGTLTHPTSTPFSNANISVSNLQSGSFTVAVGGLIGTTAKTFSFLPSGGKVTMSRKVTVDFSAAEYSSTKIGLGGIVGCANQSISIGSDANEVSVTGTITAKESDSYFFSPSVCGIGGVVGYANENLVIKNSSVTSNIGTNTLNSKSYSNGKSVNVGGIAGYVKGSTTASAISKCTTIGAIYNEQYNNNIWSAYKGNTCGGIIGAFGYVSGSSATITISNCSSSSYTYGFRGSVGGIAGYASHATISDCQFTGTVERGAPAAGVIGVAENCAVNNCNVTTTKIYGNKAGSNVGHTGGIAGVSVASSFDNCVFNGPITNAAPSDWNLGGIVGDADSNTTIGASAYCLMTGSVNGAEIHAANVRDLAVGSTYPVFRNVIFPDATPKKLSIIGDSISTFEDCIPDGNRNYYTKGEHLDDWTETYWGRLCTWYFAGQLSFEKNISWSGSCVAQDNRTGGSFRAGFITRYENDTYPGNTLGNADIVIIYGGTNDCIRTGNGVIEVTSTPSDETIASYVNANLSDLNDASFVQAYIKLIRKIRTNLPYAKILCIIGDGFDSAQVASIKTIVSTFDDDDHLKWIDFSDNGLFNNNGGVHNYNPVITKASDIHPDKNGMNYMASTIYNQMAAWMME